jgi:hypothetical protein
MNLVIPEIMVIRGGSPLLCEYLRPHLWTWCAFKSSAKTFGLDSSTIGAWVFAITLHLPSMARIALYARLVSEADVRG